MTGAGDGKGTIAGQVEGAKAKAEARKRGGGRGSRNGGGQDGEAPRQKASSFPYRVDDGRIWREVEDGEGGKKWVPFGSWLRVVASVRSHNGEDHARLVEIIDKDGVKHEYAMPMAELGGQGDTIRKEVLRLGWVPNLSVGPKWKEWLFSYLIGADPEERVRIVSGIGWHGAAFVLPDETFSARGEAERVILGGDRPDHALGVGGTLEDWQRDVAALARGNSRLVLAVSAAFAAPLLALTGDDGGGFHMKGGSSTGKSTALVVAGSVWGGSQTRGYVQSWRATDNALEALAAMHNGALLCLDELFQVEPKAAGQSAYMLGNGQGKARAGREGQARKALEWRLIFLSNGEMGLADKIKEGGGRIAAGMEVRVVDLRAEAGAGLGLFEEIHGEPSAAAFAQRLKAAAGRAYGSPARAFLRHLVADLGEAREEVSHMRKTFLQHALPPGADGQVRRVADRFALVAAAGELATFHKVTGWPEGEARRAALRCFQDWLEARGGVGSGEVADARERLRRAIEVDGHSRFLPWKGRDNDRTVANALGYRKMSNDDEERRDDFADQAALPEPQRVFYFTASGMKDVMTGLDLKAVLEGLADESVIVRHGSTEKGKAASLTRVFNVPHEGKGSVRLYQVNLSALFKDD